MTGRRSHGRLSALNGVVHQGRRAVENKLIAAGSVAPIAVTIMVAVATFLSRGRLQESVSESAVITFVAFYAALQFLRATLAAINGLSRKSYNVPTVSEILPASTEALVGYLRNACNDHVRRLEQHRETTNENVSQLALAHKSIKNAVTAIVIALLILVGLIAWEYVGLAREARTVQELDRGVDGRSCITLLTDSSRKVRLMGRGPVSAGRVSPVISGHAACATVPRSHVRWLGEPPPRRSDRVSPGGESGPPGAPGPSAASPDRCPTPSTRRARPETRTARRDAGRRHRHA